MSMTNIRYLPVLLSLLVSGGLTQAAEPNVTVYKSPTCGCCAKWVSHLRDNGFEVETVDLNDLRMIKSMSGVKPEQASCHTAKIEGYTIEGHVPAADIRRLLAEHPDARGLVVPGMPAGSPGMEWPQPQHFRVLLLKNDGSTSVYAEH